MLEATPWDRIKYKVYALLLVVAILIAAIVAAAAYNRDFESSIPVTLQASRAGLQMHPNNRVKIRGVDLGFIHSVALNKDASGVDIVMYLYPRLAGEVPVNATVSLDQLTAFGNKTVQMNYPPNPSSQMLRSGSVISATHITTEINNTFDELMTLLTEVQPSKLNATLGAFAQALNGQGDSLGATLTTADHYLKRFNGNLPQLQRDFRVTAGFSNVYANVAPNLVDLLRNVGVTSATLSDREVNFPGLLRSLHGVGGEIDGFFGANADPLTDMLSSFRPTTSLLQKYSPMVKCFIDGDAKLYYQMNRSLVTAGGAQFEAVPTPGARAYTAQDMPRVGPGPLGPDCHGLPSPGQGDLSLMDKTADPPRLNDENNNRYQAPTQPAVVSMFGQDALLGTKAGQLPVIGKGGK